MGWLFQTNHPVTDLGFYDREEELERLGQVFRELAAGSASWIAILGPRKIGKTSLLLEAARRNAGEAIRFAAVDVTEVSPVSLELFRLHALRVLDACFAAEIGESPEALASEPNTFRAALSGARSFAKLDAGLKRVIFELPEAALDNALVRQCLDLPERLAAALGVHVLVAIDELQELAQLESKRGGLEPFKVMRSVWQRHRRTAYVVSGSGRSMLKELVGSKSSPFFQHFTLMEVGALPPEIASSMLVECSPEGRVIPPALAADMVRVLGGHPFYLQLLGDALVRTEPPYAPASLKAVLQDLLFSSTGRLALYFQNEHERLVGRSTYLAGVLETLAEGPKRLAEIARALGVPAGQASGYANRLGDAVQRDDSGWYRLDDPVFGMWLRWRRPGGSTVPMSVLGEEAERAVAAHLARAGFELVYQSRASRGAFDLLALRGARQLAVQVKKHDLPVRFSRSEWNRMEADAARLGWRWLVAAVQSDGTVTLLDPTRATKAKEVRLADRAIVDNILTWVDQQP